jgi:hypothetical protein
MFVGRSFVLWLVTCRLLWAPLPYQLALAGDRELVAGDHLLKHASLAAESRTPLDGQLLTPTVWQSLWLTLVAATAFFVPASFADHTDVS